MPQQTESKLISSSPSFVSTTNGHTPLGKEDSFLSQVQSSLNSQSQSNTTRRSRRASHRTSFRFSECDHDGDLPQFHGPRRIQYFAAFAANMGALALGTVLSWSAVALPDLRKDPAFTSSLTATAETWIGSIITLGAVAAGPAAGYTIESWGRRLSMLILTGPFLLGWLFIYFANGITMILIGRFVTGFCSGVFAVAAPIFCAEMADVEIRGTLCAGFDCMISVGILFIYILGSFTSWHNQALICASFPILIFAMMLFVPESPRFLISKGRFDAAAEALTRFRGAVSKDQIHPELTALKISIQISHDKPTGFCELFRGPILRPVSIAFFIYLFQVFSGIDPILFYTVDIFASAGVDIDEYYSTIAIGTVQVIFAAIGAFMVEYFGRRVLLLLSEAVMVASLAMLGLYFYIKAENGGVSPTGPLTMLPLGSLIVYTIAYSVGVGPVGYMIMGEILPHHVKGLAGCILTSAKWFMSFMMTKFFSDIISGVGNDGAYWLFGAFCLLGFIYIFLFVPETQGKTLDEIQAGFATKDDSQHDGSSVSQRLLGPGGGGSGCGDEIHSPTHIPPLNGNARRKNYQSFANA